MRKKGKKIRNEEEEQEEKLDREENAKDKSRMQDNESRT